MTYNVFCGTLSLYTTAINNNTGTHENVYDAAVMTKLLQEFSCQRHLINVEHCRAAADSQAKPAVLTYECL